jgi:uncharacterized protein (DUF362 family)
VTMLAIRAEQFVAVAGLSATSGQGLLVQSAVDLTDFMRPTLTLIDAFRVLLRNGPGAGNPADAAWKKTLIAGTDPVALDAYAAKGCWDLDWHTLRYLKVASERRSGTLSSETARTRFVTL